MSSLVASGDARGRHHLAGRGPVASRAGRGRGGPLRGPPPGRRAAPPRRAGRGGRGRGQAPARAPLRRPVARDPHADDRVVAPVPRRRAVAEAPPPPAVPHRGAGVGGGLLQRPGGPHLPAGRRRPGGPRRRPGGAPRPRPVRAPSPTSTPRSSAWRPSPSRARPSPRCCSTSGSRPASATSTRARSSTPVASTRSPPWREVPVELRRRLLDAGGPAAAPQPDDHPPHDGRRTGGLGGRVPAGPTPLPPVRHPDPVGPPRGPGPLDLLVPALPGAAGGGAIPGAAEPR